MKRVLLCLCAVTCLAGCTVLRNPYFWRQTAGAVLRAAYHSGGAEAVGDRLDRLHTSGHLSEETVGKLKAAAQKGYDKLQESLTDEAMDDLLVDDEMLGDVSAE